MVPHKRKCKHSYTHRAGERDRGSEMEGELSSDFRLPNAAGRMPLERSLGSSMEQRLSLAYSFKPF